MEDTTTPILGLTKPGFDRPADIREINGDLDIIDAAFASIVPQLKLPQRGTTGGIVFAADTNLYSPSADLLMTDDAFRIAGLLGLTFGATGDTNLYRSAADTLMTDDSFVIGGSLTVTGLVNPIQTGQLVLPLRGPTGGIVLAGDTNLYSPSADVLRTDDVLVATDIGLPDASIRAEWPAADDLIDFAQGDAAIRHPDGAIEVLQNTYYDGAAASYKNTANLPVSHYRQGGGAHQWFGSGSPGIAGTAFAPTPRMVLDAGGHLGIGAAARSEWAAADLVVDFGAGLGALRQGGTSILLTQNNYFDGTSWRNATNAPTSTYAQQGGLHRWYGGASPGAAGTTYTPAQRMSVDASGNVAVSSADPTGSYPLEVVRSLNSSQVIAVTNNSVGAAAAAGVQANCGTGLLVGVASAAYAAPLGGKAFLQSNAPQGLMLQNNAAGPIQFYVGSGATTLAAQFNADGSLQFGAAPATTGTIRLPNTGAVDFRNGANTANVVGLSLDAANTLILGQSTVVSGVSLRAASQVGAEIGGTLVGYYTATRHVQLTIANAPSYCFDTGLSTGMGSNAVDNELNFYVGGNAKLRCFVNNLQAVVPLYPNGNGVIDLGASGARWLTIYSTNVLNVSHSSTKRDWTPLAVADALGVLRATTVGTFRYAPTRAGDEVAEWTRVGVLAEDAHALISPDGQHVSPIDVACLALAAIQELDRRIGELEAG